MRERTGCPGRYPGCRSSAASGNSGPPSGACRRIAWPTSDTLRKRRRNCPAGVQVGRVAPGIACGIGLYIRARTSQRPRTSGCRSCDRPGSFARRVGCIAQGRSAVSLRSGQCSHSLRRCCAHCFWCRSRCNSAGPPMSAGRAQARPPPLPAAARRRAGMPRGATCPPPGSSRIHRMVLPLLTPPRTRAARGYPPPRAPQERGPREG